MVKTKLSKLTIGNSPILRALIGVIILMAAAQNLFAIHSVRVAFGLSRPIYVTAPPSDFDRLFIIEQYCARIRILRLATNTVDARPFLNIDSLVMGSCTVNPGLERGFLGLVFHPDYANNGFFYVYYSANSGNTILARYQVSADPDSADAASAEIMMDLPQPGINHKAGMLEFGPNDGYLYISVGDGRDPWDADNHAQNDSSLLGKILRIDVNGDLPYEIPPTNPFVHPDSLQLDEIWAKGLRNPWRSTFDPLTGDYYIADVGQNEVEELNYQPASSTGGENYGWRCMEGDSCTGRSGCTCNDPNLTYPIYTYLHGGSPVHCAITGGYVYRGCRIPEMYGRYIWTDYCSNVILSGRVVDGEMTDIIDHTAELDPGGGLTLRTIPSFGKDAYGEIYLVDRDGHEVFKIVPDTVIDCNNNGSADFCDIQNGTSEDHNGNGIPDECDCIHGIVEDLTILTDNDDVTLRWTSLGIGEESYSIYRSSFSNAVFPGPSWTPIAVEIPAPELSTPLSYLDAGIAADSIVQFYVVTMECESEDD